MASPPRLVKTRQLPPAPARGIISSRASGKRINARSFEPPVDLSDIVERFWSGDWALPVDEPHTTLLLSDPCVHLVFEDGPQGREARIVGLWTQLWERRLEGRGRVRGVKLHPGSASALLPTPIEQWSNKLTPLGDVLSVDPDFIEVALSDDLDAAWLAIAEFIRCHRSSGSDTSRSKEVVAFARETQRVTRVEVLAERFKMSVRALQRLFKKEVGASPKWLIRRYRLQEVATRIEQGTHVSLAALAAELGYTDQAHLAREFKNAVGKSPSEFSAQSGATKSSDLSTINHRA